MSNTETTIAELKAKLSPEVTALIETLRPAATASLDKTTGTGSLSENDYEASLVAVGLTKEVDQKLSAHKTNYALATGFLAGELAVPLMTENKEITRVTLTAPTINKDAVTATFDRSRVVPDKNAEGGKRTAYGALSIDLSFHGGKNGANLTTIKKIFSTAATAALSD